MKVKLTYFKQTGKYYSDGEFDAPNDAALYDIWTMVRNMLGNRELPGLVKGCSEFIILVESPEHPHNHPHLILP